MNPAFTFHDTNAHKFFIELAQATLFRLDAFGYLVGDLIGSKGNLDAVLILPFELTLATPLITTRATSNVR
jgi:hypothetical protein